MGDLGKVPSLSNGAFSSLHTVVLFTGAIAFAGCSLSGEAEPQQREAEALSEFAGLFGAFGEDGSGCAYGVMRDGELRNGGGSGLANVEHGVPISTKTTFYMASVSKQFTALALALLVSFGPLRIEHLSPRGVARILARAARRSRA